LTKVLVTGSGARELATAAPIPRFHWLELYDKLPSALRHRISPPVPIAILAELAELPIQIGTCGRHRAIALMHPDQFPATRWAVQNLHVHPIFFTLELESRVAWPNSRNEDLLTFARMIAAALQKNSLE
jgi:hypothetical protein